MGFSVVYLPELKISTVQSLISGQGMVIAIKLRLALAHFCSIQLDCLMRQIILA